MQMDPDLRRAAVTKLATLFYAKGQPLASAIVFADIASELPSDPGVWAGLGAALASSAGVLVRKPFFQGAARALARGKPLATGTPYAEVIDEWEPRVKAELTKELEPMRDDELPALLEFLHVTPKVMVDAIQGLPEEDRMMAVMLLGERDDERYLPLLCEAISGSWGPGPMRSGLKRAGRYRGRPEITAALASLDARGLSAEAGAYLMTVAPGTSAGSGPRRGLPGGIALPAVVFLLSMTTFLVCWTHPSLFSLGEAIGTRVSPAGLGVIFAAISLFWLLVAIGKRPPTPQ